MRPAKLREESSILKNIQRREMIDKVLNFSRVNKTWAEIHQTLFFNLGPSSEETSFLTTFCDLYFSHHYTHITHYKS